MKPEAQLPRELEDRYYRIESKFNAVCDDWEKYNDQIIPEDKEFAEEIIQFIIDVIEYMEQHYDSLPLNEWLEFLAGYWYKFYYGPNGDDRNYLAFDEAPVLDIFLTELSDLDLIKTKGHLGRIKEKFIEAKSKF